MTVRLITGYTGTDHVTSSDDGHLHIGMFGSGSYVLNTGQKLLATLQSASSVSIASGDMILQGRHIVVTGTNLLTINNGSQGLKRRDFVVMRYRRNSGTGIESAELAIVQGTSGSSYVDPSITTGNLYNGDSLAEFPLYKIELDGLSVSDPVQLFEEPMLGLGEHLQTLAEDVENYKDDVVSILATSSNFGSKVAEAAAGGMTTVLSKAVGMLMFPVGSTYLTTENVNPAARFGGTWEKTATRYLANQGHNDSISYRSHIANKGWETTYKKDNQVSGITGKALATEAIQIKMTTARSYSAVYVWTRTA